MISTPFVDVPPVRYGGTELVVSMLVEELVARGHDVILYATGESKAPAEIRWLYRHASWPPNGTVELAHVAWAIQDVLAGPPVDVIHAHVPPVLAFSRLVDAPVVYTVHHAREEPLCQLYQLAQGPTVSMVAISDRQRELMADACDARVVYHGLDPMRYPAGQGAGGYAAFLGRFAPEKGAHVAIDAACKAGLPIRLAGRPHYPRDGEYYEREIRPRLERTGVSWEGEADHRAKLRLLGGALVTLFPIVWEEPFGLVMIESMLCGTPVLSFGRGSAPEVVDPGITGWIVEDIDEMAWRANELARGGFDRARCRQRAVERFAAARMADGYLDVYERAVGRTGTSQVIIS